VTEDADECIANALWHECGKWLECKTEEMENAALVIIERLQRNGWRLTHDNNRT
jgi:hypothetical protein